METKNWKYLKLKEVCSIIMGQSPPSETYNTSGIGLPFFQGKAEFTDIHPVPEKWCTKANKIAEPNDILLSVRAPVGSTNIADTKCGIGRGLAALRFENYKYGYYYLKSIQQELDSKGTGTTFKAISGDTIRETLIPYPDLDTQENIVCRIEELLSEIEASKSALLLAREQLKIFRSSTLKFAFEGRFTNSKVPSNGLPEDWKQVKLGELANAIDPQPSHRTPPVDLEGVPYASIKDFDSELDKIDLTSARKVSPSVLEEHIGRYTLQDGDFVIGKIGTIGKPVRIILPQNYCLSANIVLIQPRKIDPTFLFYFFQSNIIEKAFSSGANSTTQAAFGIQKVRELVVNLPSPEEQKKIVIEIEDRISVAEKIGEEVKISLKQLETLKQSVLKKAFEGKLVNEN